MVKKIVAALKETLNADGRLKLNFEFALSIMSNTVSIFQSRNKEKNSDKSLIERWQNNTWTHRQ